MVWHQLTASKQSAQLQTNHMDRQTIEFYLPYYYKPNAIFQQEFLKESLNEAACMNEAPITFARTQPKKLAVRCAIDPTKCPFKLDFLQVPGQEGTKGMKLTDICLIHFCPPQFDERAVLRDRKQLIHVLRGEIIKLLEKPFSKYDEQPSKVIMRELAVSYGQFPNFLYRGLSRKTQARICKHFDRTVRKLFRWMQMDLRKSGTLKSMLDREMEVTDEESSIDEERTASYV